MPLGTVLLREALFFMWIGGRRWKAAYLLALVGRVLAGKGFFMKER